MAKFAYLVKSLRKQFDASSRVCQNCKSSDSVLIERKYMVTALRRCSKCGLMFRTPIDSVDENFDFYNESYTQGFTTDLPTDEELRAYIANGFKGTEKDYTYYIEILKRLGVQPGARIFDFGCSWGYGSYQLKKAGYEVVSYEISRPRCEYGVKNLQVDAVSDLAEILRRDAGTFDCFFSAHVLEHVPSPNEAFAMAQTLLKDGGVFLAFTPNGSADFKAVNPNWSMLWGEVHPNFLDIEFYERQFAHSPRIIGSSPVSDKFSREAFNGSGKATRLPLDKYELVFAAQKVAPEW